MLERLRGILKYFILQVEATRDCNLDCRICMRRRLKSHTGFLSFNNFKMIVSSYNFREVALHGWGEPLLNREIFQMIKYAKEQGLRTSLTTNGTLIGRTINDILDSRLDTIAFGYYDKNILMKSIDNVEKLISEKKERKSALKTFFDITIFRENIDEIFDVIKKAGEIGVDTALLHRLFNLHSTSKDFSLLSEKEENKLFPKIKALGKELNFNIYLPKKHTLPCRIVENTVFVTYDGKATPCCFLPEFYIGDAKEGIGNILRSMEYRNFLTNMKNHPICGRCVW